MYKTGRLSFAEGHVTYARTCFSGNATCREDRDVYYVYVLSRLNISSVDLGSAIHCFCAPLSQRCFHVFISRHYWRSICCIYKGLLLSVRGVKIWIRNRLDLITSWIIFRPLWTLLLLYGILKQLKLNVVLCDYLIPMWRTKVSFQF